MKEINKIQFLPGLTEKPKNYRGLSKYFNILDVDWNTGKIKPKIRKTDVLAGFSMGAIYACEYASKHKVKTLILCSLTPGAETLKNVMADNVIFLVGEKEKWVLKEIKRVKKTIKAKSRILVIPGVDHKISGDYKKTLINVAKNIT